MTVSAFGDPFGDIDRTRPGEPYVVDSDGWGWFFLFYLAAMPFLVLGLCVSKLSALLVQNMALCLAVYFLLSVVAGFRRYRRGTRFRGIGICATVLTMVPMAALLYAYAIPFVILSPGVGAIFDFVLVVGLCIGGEVLIFSLSGLIRNGLVHFALALVFLALGGALLAIGIGSEQDVINMTSIGILYAG